MTTQVTTVDIKEWEDDFRHDLVLSNRDRRLVETLKDVEIREMRNGIYIKASSWVGVVRFEAFTLRIRPKLSNVDLMRMILIGGGFDRLRRFRATREYEFEDNISLFDLVALLLADACAAVARDGLLRGYVVEEDDLPVMRGRLRVADQMRRRFGQVNRLECLYDDHHADIIDNQILNTALALCRRHIEHPLVRRRVWQLADTFAVACGQLSGNWREVRAGMAYNRLNARYEEAHTLAWFLLDGLGVNDLLAAGNTPGVAFLLNMNPLFEKFIEALVRFALHEDDITTRAGSKSSGHIWDVGHDRSYAQIIPDLLVETNSGVQLAIDAKYKRYDDYKLAQSDIYQTFLYSYAFRDPSGMMPSAILLYPADSKTMNLTRLHIRDGQGNTQARLHSLGVDIPRALNGLDGLDDGGLTNHIREVVQSLMR